MSNVPRTRAQRRAALEFWVLLATFGVSLFMMGWVAGSAAAARGVLCERVYPAPETFTGRHGIPLNATPAGIEYARCLRARTQWERNIASYPKHVAGAPIATLPDPFQGMVPSDGAIR